MEYLSGLSGLYIYEETAVTLGKFDGLHRGHQKLIKRTMGYQRQGYKSTVFTLDFGRKEMLLTGEERREILEKKGVSYLIDCPFLPEVASMEPEDFIQSVLVDKLHAKKIVVGEDFHFGHNRKGDARLLKELEHIYEYEAEIVRKEKEGDREISSTYIREEIAKGNMEAAGRLLGYPYFVSGEVLHGRHIGSRLLVPTTNLVPTTRKLLPPNGVYISRTLVNGREYGGITNIGYKPTVGEKFRGVETYMFDFDEDLYGCDITVQLLKFLRPEKKFDSIDLLREQMKQDIGVGRSFFHV
ncbi:MAG TPA: bifunctional riboflavin kinase/FAD synthetase [Candidatus Limivivens merdigallinarum]|uniref:Riboflavin biosynthesis protein n=1 Tax=Candidatus Limivivens merdigallinarum TaxID=2840859 RepID=A0A9D0ZX89_9FIRM|nr:bifunctional riboflavin kinase/FAD synthetase [Candidatus Limivivens merdigallinarum]